MPAKVPRPDRLRGQPETRGASRHTPLKASLTSEGASKQAKGNETWRFLSPLESPFFPFALSPPAGIMTIVSRYAARRQSVNARPVLAGKGPLRRAKNRRALACSAPFWPDGNCDGRLRREHDRRRDPVFNPGRSLLGCAQKQNGLAVLP